MPFNLKGKKILVTAGPTREYWDPVRFLSNPSSGRMGLLLAAALKSAGAKVTVVLGPTTETVPKNIRVVPVVNAVEMSREVLSRLKGVDVFISTAAVSDYRFEKSTRTKIKKKGEGRLRVNLVRNPDILALAGKLKGKKDRPVLVGFALETERLAVHAGKKLKDKNLDLIVGNDPASFANDMIKPLWIERGFPPLPLPFMGKDGLARKITHWLDKRLD